MYITIGIFGALFTLFFSLATYHMVAAYRLNRLVLEYDNPRRLSPFELQNCRVTITKYDAVRRRFRIELSHPRQPDKPWVYYGSNQHVRFDSQLRITQPVYKIRESEALLFIPHDSIWSLFARSFNNSCDTLSIEEQIDEIRSHQLFAIMFLMFSAVPGSGLSLLFLP